MSDTINTDIPIAFLTKAEIEARIATYEQEFGISSEEFVKRRRNLQLPDTWESMEWNFLLDTLQRSFEMSAIPSINMPVREKESSENYQPSAQQRGIEEVESIESEIDPQSVLTQEEIESTIAQYEQDFGMSSEEFMRRWRAGIAPDTFETNTWAIFLSTR